MNKGIDNLNHYGIIFKEVLDLTDDGFVITAIDGTILEINNSYCNFLGTNREYAIGRNIKEFIDNTKMLEVAKTQRKEVNTIHELVEGQHYKGDKFLFVSRAPIIEGDETIAVVAQVKFRKDTIELTKKLESQDKEIKYYKEELQKLDRGIYNIDSIIGESSLFLESKKLATKASLCDLPVLIYGETGTGKEVFAKGIHYSSDRKDNLLVSINCAAIPADLMESELFGYEEGAFTGAIKGGKKGKFELADGGTLFLDEIGDMPIHMQAKLLRVLEEKEIEKIGSYYPIPVDTRIIAASNKDLGQLVKEKKFRKDLYYRLNVINIRIPPLKERKEDIMIFANYFLEELNSKNKTKVIISKKAEELLINHKWDGNVRELKNVIESAYVLAENDCIGIKNLPSNLLAYYVDADSKTNKGLLNNILNEFEKDIIIETLFENNFNIAETANALGIHRTTLYKKLERLDIKLERYVN